MGMKVAIVYSTRTGNTRRLAEGIARALREFAPILMDLRQVGKRMPEADVFLVGYWADKGRADKLAENFLKRLSWAKVGLFGTLGAYPYGPHSRHIMEATESCLPKDCLLMGHFLCQGPVDPKLLERMGSGYTSSPDSRRRHAIAVGHPNQNDMLFAAALFRERILAEQE